MKNKLILFIAIVLVGLTTTSNAQERCFNEGTSALNLGVGFGNTVAYGGGVYAYGYAPSVAISPAFTASYEYGIKHVGIGIIGAGLELGFQGSRDSYNNGSNVYSERWTTLGFCPRATYHFDILNKGKFDVYPIVQINVYSSSYSNTFPSNGTYVNQSSSSVFIHPSILVAARYFFTPNIGVYSELGYDIAIIKAGLSIKFGGN
ncbi:MAG TPA: hypothetical protein VK835_11580 [Bacteroidia bacterium]|jgi:hypothetical protein|nr:hypothetical protein [Bacteroidia bacterium]